MDEQKSPLPQEPAILPEAPTPPSGVQPGVAAPAEQVQTAPVQTEPPQPTFGGQIPTAASPSAVQQKETDVLGIVSIVLFFVFTLAGLIVGIVGIRRAKKHGYSATLSIIGTVLNGLASLLIVPIMLFLIFATMGGVQTAARDTERQTDIKALQAQLESYYAQNGYYPVLADVNSSSWRQANMSSLDPAALSDPRSVTDSSLKSAPVSGSYSYQVYEVNGAPCTIASKCAKYTLTATLDSPVNGTTTYTRTSLN